MLSRLLLALLGLALFAGAARAQTVPVPIPKPDMEAADSADDSGGTPTPAAKPAAATLPPGKPAKEIFGALAKPADLAPRAIGSYAKGCLAGAVALPINGETWQVMRLSRNRNWGHPDLIALLERLSKRMPQVAGWRGLLVGDIAQPRGGPMLTGHASHQIGLDADVWLTEMPERKLSNGERETMVPINLVAADWNDVDPKAWKPEHLRVIKAAAQMPEVARIFSNPAIKKALCREAGSDRAWLKKVRPTPGHNYHFHIRIRCPAGLVGCADQTPPPDGDGCGKELDWWFSDEYRKPKKSTVPYKPPPPMTMDALPAACRTVATAP
jgi:penicillin-insensitive murein endopeptidase